MRKNILAICSLVLAFPLVGQAMQPAISGERALKDYPTPDRSKVLAFPGADGAGNIPPAVPEVLYTLLLLWQTTARREHSVGLSTRKVPVPLSSQSAESLNYKKH